MKASEIEKQHRALDPVVAPRYAQLDGVDTSRDLLGERQDPASRLGGDQAVGAAEKQPRAQLLLERGQAASHRRVLDAELTPGAREASRASDRQEVAEIVPVGHPCRFARWVCRFNHSAARVRSAEWLSSQLFRDEMTQTKETIMNALDIVTKLDKEICGGELAKAAAYLADDFRFVGVAPQPLNKAEALGVWATIRAALPDFSHNMRVVREACQHRLRHRRGGGHPYGDALHPERPDRARDPAQVEEPRRAHRHHRARRKGQGVGRRSRPRRRHGGSARAADLAIRPLLADGCCAGRAGPPPNLALQRTVLARRR